MYGYPAPDAMEEAENGNLKLGGCEVLIDGFEMPERFCKDCETEWCVDRLGADAIKKVRFKYWSNWGFYDPDSIVEDQWAFEIFKDGTIKYFAYPRESRRVLDKDKILIDIEKVQGFYENLLDAFKPWNMIEECRVCDGCSYRLDITYCDGRKKSHTGDIGGGTIDKLIMDFIESIPEMKENINESEDE
jgi:hypothetical protein